MLIGPWVHEDISSSSKMIRETLAWLHAHLKGYPGSLREAPARLFVMGAQQWRDFHDWPQPAQSERWYFQPGGVLAPASPPTSEPDRYRYDPADPTPAVGGNSLGAKKLMGPKDNRKLVARGLVGVKEQRGS